MPMSKKTLVVVLLIGATFGAGYLTAYLPARRAAGEAQLRVEAATEEIARVSLELDRVRRELELTGLSGRLGRIFLDVYQNNFGVASERMTPLFNSLQALVDSGSLSTEQRGVVDKLLARRDKVVGNLATANPDVRQEIAELFSTWLEMLGV